MEVEGRETTGFKLSILQEISGASKAKGCDITADIWDRAVCQNLFCSHRTFNFEFGCLTCVKHQTAPLYVYVCAYKGGVWSAATLGPNCKVNFDH